MHSAAERAKLRRQQEEEERERERERARRKAAELESKMKESEVKATKDRIGAEAMVKSEQDVSKAQVCPVLSPSSHTELTFGFLQVIEIIESAVHSVSQGASSKSLASVAEGGSSPSAASSRPLFGRAPSTRGGIRPQPRRPSFPAPPASQDPISPAVEAESWRSKTGPLKSSHRTSYPGASPVIPVAQPPPVVFHDAMESLNLKAGEEVEIVDFSELGRLVGEIQESDLVIEESPVQASQLPTRPPRPVAADFFEDSATRASDMPPTPSEEEVSWRRKSTAVEAPVPAASSEQTPVHDEPTKPDLHINPPPLHSHASSHRRMSTASDDHSRPYGHGHPRSPLTPSYREAPMSALDDTMARIRGAMNGLQQKGEPPVLKPPPKWLPPALRARSAALQDDAPPEVFDVSAIEPPRSPGPAWGHFLTKLPNISRPQEPLTRKQLNMSKTVPHVRSDIFSWDPPIEGMNRRDFHLNDILFQRPHVMKGRIRYNISLPRFHRGGKPVVNLPPRPNGPPVNGTFGKRGEADEASTWRKPAPPTPNPLVKGLESQEGLATTSRSPPPETPSAAVTSPKSKTEEVTSPTVSVAAAVRSRTQPKMPHGSDVAFYRDSRSDNAPAPGTAVKFIFSSELEESTATAATVNSTAIQLETRASADIDSPATSRVVSAQIPVVSSQPSATVQKFDTKKAEAVRDCRCNCCERMLKYFLLERCRAKQPRLPLVFKVVAPGILFERVSLKASRPGSPEGGVGNYVK